MVTLGLSSGPASTRSISHDTAGSLGFRVQGPGPASTRSISHDTAGSLDRCVQQRGGVLRRNSDSIPDLRPVGTGLRPLFTSHAFRQ